MACAREERRDLTGGLHPLAALGCPESFCRALAGALGASTRALRSLESSPARKLASVTRVLGTGAHSTSEIIWALTRTAADGSRRETLCRLLYGWGLFVSSCGATHVRYWYSRACHEFDQECPLSTALPKVRGHRGHTMRRTSPVYSSPFYSLFIPPQNMPTARRRARALRPAAATCRPSAGG